MRFPTSLLILISVASILPACTDGESPREPSPRPLRVFANGREITEPGPLPRQSEVLVQNENLALFLPGADDQRAGVQALLRAEGRWWPLTSAYYGDYTYLGSGVRKPPTGIRLAELDAEWAKLELSFENHRILPDYANGKMHDYPFKKTLWLRAGDSGYYTLVEPLTELPEALLGIEHELGFGGLWGEGKLISSSGLEITFGRLKETREIKQPQAFAQFLRRGEGLVRTLIPFPPAPVLVPFFSEQNFGSVWIYEDGTAPYGAFLHAAPVQGVPPVVEICDAARRRSPPELEALRPPGPCADK